MDRYANLKKIAVPVCGAILLAFALTVHPQAQEVTEEEEEEHGVTESDVERYIEVYAAMQADHTLTIDEALEPHQMTVGQFRSLERRIQREQRWVDRVRSELLERAKKRTAETQITPGGSQAEPAPQP